MKIVLNVKGSGHVPSFKNKKRIVGKNLITRPDVKKWMDQVIQDFESQLLSATQTNVAGTSTEGHPLSLIVSSLPLDDSRQWISQLIIVDADVAPGEEGAQIIIEPVRELIL